MSHLEHSPPVPAPDAQAPGAPAPLTATAALIGMARGELTAELAGLVDRPFRVEQIYRALHERAVASFDEMTDLPLALRRELATRYRVGLPEVARLEPAADGTTKFLFRLADGASIEAVDIPEGKRRTLCLSSQAGCALGCTFCVTGYWGAGRDLDGGEIIGQVQAIRRHQGLGASGLNLVFMGMGEPLLNLGAVRRALAVLTEAISWRRITVSTAGVVPGIDEMASWPQRPNLAVSLHAPDDERRSRIIPLNRTYPLSELLAALGRYPLEHGRRLTFEYLLIRDFNDRPEDADATAGRLAGLPAKVNLIPVNPDPVLGAAMVPPADEVVERFRERLRRRGLVATVRRRRGDDVQAACGQLRAFGRDPRGAPARRRSATPGPGSSPPASRRADS